MMQEIMSGPNLDKLPAFRLKALWVGFKEFYIMPAEIATTIRALNRIGFFTYGRFLGYKYMPMTGSN